MRDFNKIPGFIRHLRKELMDEADDATEEVYNHMIDQWDKGMDSQGRAWEPLSPVTVRQKGHSDILIETGDMKEASGYEMDADNMTAEIYVEDPKIVYHEFGTEKIPKRPVLGPTHPVLVEAIEESVGDAVDEAFVKSTVTSGILNGGIFR